jgi:hypothetical protein
MGAWFFRHVFLQWSWMLDAWAIYNASNTQLGRLMRMCQTNDTGHTDPNMHVLLVTVWVATGPAKGDDGTMRPKSTS